MWTRVSRRLPMDMQIEEPITYYNFETQKKEGRYVTF